MAAAVTVVLLPGDSLASCGVIHACIHKGIDLGEATSVNVKTVQRGISEEELHRHRCNRVAWLLLSCLPMEPSRLQTGARGKKQHERHRKGRGSTELG